MDKRLTEIIIITVLISLILGFYIGRYYERKLFANRIRERGNSEFRMGDKRGVSPMPRESTMPSEKMFDN